MKSYLYFKRKNNHQVKKQVVSGCIIFSIVIGGNLKINMLPFSARKIYLRYFWISLSGSEKKHTSMLYAFADGNWHFLAILSLIDWHFSLWKKWNVNFKVKMKSFTQTMCLQQSLSVLLLENDAEKVSKQKELFPV